jgi:hypothetical protein
VKVQECLFKQGHGSAGGPAADADALVPFVLLNGGRAFFSGQQ